MKGHLFWFAVWAAVIAAGWFVVDRLLAPPPVARTVEPGRTTIAVPAARDGHYYLEGEVNGVAVRFMVDTGASYVSVGEDFARKARLQQGNRGYFSTANGTVEGRIVKGQTIRVDAFQVSGLSVAVMPAYSGEALLGQNFLRQFEVSQANGILRLAPRPAAD